MAGSIEQNDGLGQAETAQERLNWDFYDLDFTVQRSRRYHEKLCGFYGVWRDWLKIVSVVAGSGVFVLLMASASHAAEIISAFVAAWAILDFIVEPTKKADQHCELGKKFTDLAIDSSRPGGSIFRATILGQGRSGSSCCRAPSGAGCRPRLPATDRPSKLIVTGCSASAAPPPRSRRATDVGG
ncbi:MULTISPECIES: hypothetical protein [unclassified Bradyrhizobium]